MKWKDKVSDRCSPKKPSTREERNIESQGTILVPVLPEKNKVMTDNVH